MKLLIKEIKMIDYDEMDKWIQVCEIKENELCFTPVFLEKTKTLGGKRREFVSFLVGGWERSFNSLLDYFGDPELEKDEYDGIDGHGMDINEMIPETLECKGQPLNGLTADWFRDVMRAKLASLRLPEKLIQEYIKLWQEKIKR
jgi:hypothetical protein